MHQPIHIAQCIMTGMYQCMDIVYLGQFILGTRGPRQFIRGHIVPGRPMSAVSSVLSVQTSES